MLTTFAYSALKADLYHPCHEHAAAYFPEGRPDTDAALCAELSRLVYCPFEGSTTCRQHIVRVLEAIGFSQTYFFTDAATSIQGV